MSATKRNSQNTYIRVIHCKVMALFEMGLVMMFLAGLLIVLGVAFFFWGLKHALVLALNSVIGFFALYAVQAYWLPELVINIWSVLIVALFGLAGLIVVLLFHWVGIWF